MKMRLNRSLYALLGVLAVSVTGLTPALATENGASAYPTGVDSYDVAMVPPPGHAALLNYSEYLNAQVYSGTTKVDGSKVGVFVTAFRGVYTWPVAFNGGTITLSSDLIFGGGSVHLKLPYGGGMENSSTGLINPCIWPVSVNYHKNGTFFSGTLAVWLPFGTYNKNETPTKGLGLNYYTFGPTFYLTQFIGPKLQLDLSSVTEINTENHQTHYQSGAAETFIFGSGYTVLPNFQVGPTAYLYDQFTDDKEDGVTVENGNRGRALAIGVQAVYSLGMGAVGAKYYHNVWVRNRSGGDQFWLEWMAPLG